MSFVALVLSIFALVKIKDLNLRMASFEKKQKEGSVQSSSSRPQESVSLHKEEVKEDVLFSSEKVHQKQEEEEESAFIKWIKEDWLLKLGGTLVIMGVLFFLSLAYTAVGPQGKIVMGYVFGTTLMIFGFKYAKKLLVGGSAVHLIGAIIIIITTYLARLPSYNIFNEYVATLLMFLTTVCIALTAYAYKRAPLAHVGLVLAAIVPLLTGGQQESFTQLLAYLAVVILGILWLAFMTKWRTLVLLSLVVLIYYSAMFIGGFKGDSPMLLIDIVFVVAFGIIFYLTSLFSIMRTNGETGSVDGAIALLNAGFALMWIIGEASPQTAPIYIAFIALIYAVGFFLVYRITNVYTSFLVYGGVALGMLTTSVMLELSGKAEVVALLLIGAGVTVLTYYLSKREDTTKVASLFNVLPLMYVLVSMGAVSKAIDRGLGLADAWKDLSVIALAVIIFYLLFGYFKNKSKDLMYLSLWVAHGINIFFIWYVIHLIIKGGVATIVAIGIYTVIGLVVLFRATQHNNLITIKYARIWLGLVAGRVVFFDAWQVGDIALTVFICIFIGVLLLSSAFFIKKVVQA